MKFFKHIFLAVFALPLVHTQILGQTDLRIDLTGVQLTEASVGSSFAVTAVISLDVNGTTPVPAGEVITAVLELKSPDGLILATHTETWNGFPETGRSDTLDNDPRTIDQVIFQIPWSEAQKWSATARWSISARVGGASAESDLSDNEATQSFELLIPNLAVTSLQPSGTYLPGSDVTAVVTVENTGQVRTQEGVFFPLMVILRDSGGNVVDQETLILPRTDQGVTPSLEPNQAYEITLTNLRLPDDAEGNYTIEAVVDPSSAFQGHIIHETVEDSSDGTSDNRQQQTITINSGTVTLTVDPDSFTGESGTFMGLEPIRLAFAVRNEGNVAIGANDSFTIQVVLSEDISFSTSDFILREFDLSGNALGANLLPNETVSFNWVQQLPDNFEGDYYLLVNVPETDQIFALDNTPIISLISRNAGTTDLQAPGENGATERPHTNDDGSWFVYEETNNGIQQIYLRDRFLMPDPSVAIPQSTLITAAFDGGGFGNGNSLRPRISADGSTVVFHSRASNLVVSDKNGQSDVFVYTAYNSKLTRLVDFSRGEDADGGSFYADVNGDGTLIVFESIATNLQTDGIATSGRQIFLWDTKTNTIRAITDGNGDSRRPTIDDLGKTITFSSDANNLISGDTNGHTDVFIFHTDTNATYRASLRAPTLNNLSAQADGGPSDQPEISGDGSTIVYRSEATNLVTLKGIASVQVVNGGAGYLGTPSIIVTDLDGSGEDAILSLEGGIDAYGQILPTGVSIVESGMNYTDPIVTIIPDPTQPAPTQDATITVHLSHPDGDLYKIKVADVNGSTLLSGQAANYSIRISERNDIGANMASRDPSVSYDGSTIVYSTKSSNLLDNNVTRSNGEVFFNTPVQQATARAVIIGGVGEIEVQNTGSGYQSGFLKIEDYSGGGSGASATYQVDTFGRISSVTVINAGSGYRLDTTVVSVDNPRGGIGFVAGTIRHPQDSGTGSNRQGGGRVHRIEMIEHGSGYPDTNLQTLISIDGDGVDLDSNGEPDAKINPDRIKIDQRGGVYLEQKFDVELLSTTSLATTVLTIADANKSIQVDFASGEALPFTIGLSDNNLSRICEDLITIIQTQWSSPSTLLDGPLIENNSKGGTSFTFSALTGVFETNNPSSIRITSQSNLLFSGSGFTRATPVISPPPVIHGYSEVLSGTTTEMGTNARPLTLAQTDLQTDDVYLFSSDTNRSERLSRSSFGFPVNYLPSGISTMPSNRFPSISGNGRHVFFSSDATGRGGLAFGNSNQVPSDNNTARDILHHDRKISTTEPTSPVTASMISPSPTDSSLNFYPLGAQIEVTVSVASTLGTVEDINLFLNGIPLNLEQFFPTDGQYSPGGIYGFYWTPPRPGTYELLVQAVTNYQQVSRITNLSKATVQIGTEPVGQMPVIQLTDPVPGAFGDTAPDYSFGSEMFINVEAYDADGDLEYVRIMLNGELLGEAEGRFGNTYIYKWKIAQQDLSRQSFVLQAQAMDNDKNVVRSATLAGILVENNVSQKPYIKMDSVNIDQNGVRLRAVAGISPSSRNPSISRVQFFVNGVTIDAVNSPNSFLPSGDREYVFNWMPEEAGTYTFYAMAVGSVGDNGDNYKISEPFQFVVTQENIDSLSSVNDPPIVNLITPGENTVGTAVAKSLIGSVVDESDSNFRKVTGIEMLSFGFGYDEAPEVKMYGGGGTGAIANAVLTNGAVTKVTLNNGGSGYSPGLTLVADSSAGGSGLQLTPEINDGVLTSIPITDGGTGYSSSDVINIFDLQNVSNTGSGAKAVPVVDPTTGSLLGITILDGGKNYDTNYLRVSIVGTGTGFDANETGATVLNGVVTNVLVSSTGSGFTPGSGFTLTADPATVGAGTGLDAEVLGSDIVDGSVSLQLTSGGSGYYNPPVVILNGGKRDLYDDPFTFVEDARILLYAEAFDTDGVIQEVKFYGNGQLLGNAPLGNLTGLQIISPGTGFTTAPTVAISGGGGQGAEAEAVIDEETGQLSLLSITNPGLGYTTPPVVTLTPSNGAIVLSTIDISVVNNARRIAGTDRYVLDWVPSNPGTYNISVEAIDEDLRSTILSTDRYVVIVPKSTSQAPTITLLGPPDMETYTTGSKLRMYAQADDPDGTLDWVRFFVNGQPYGSPISAFLGKGNINYPYSLEWTVPATGVYSFFAMAMDNSGNGVMSTLSNITTTTGLGNLPQANFTKPQSVATADAVPTSGAIQSISVTHGGSGYVTAPVVEISGDGQGATATAVIQSDPKMSRFGEVTSIQITSVGYGYTYAEARLIGGFPRVKPTGQTAVAELRFASGSDSNPGNPFVVVLDSGSGYISPPEVKIEGPGGVGDGMTAIAVLEGDQVTSVQITNPGNDNYVREGNKVIFEGGFPFYEMSLQAEVSDPDGNDTIERVTLYENGVPLSNDFSEPFEFVWDSGPSGYYDLHFSVRDNQGNVNVSPVLRQEVFHSIPPSFAFQPVAPATVSSSGLLSGGSFVTGNIPSANLSYSGLDYHSPPTVVFEDSSGSGAIGYAIIEDGKVTGVEIVNGGSGYSDQAVIRLAEGFDTSVTPVRIELGETFIVSLYCDDPDTLIDPEAFRVFVNDAEDITIGVSGVDPVYNFAWTPSVIGRYSIRVQGATLDGVLANTGSIEIEVFNDPNDTISLFSFGSQSITAEARRFSLGSTIYVPFEVSSKLGLVSEVHAYDNGIQVGSYYAAGPNQLPNTPVPAQSGLTSLGTTHNISYDPNNENFLLSWEPAYEGERELLIWAKLANGTSVFSNPVDFQVIEGKSGYELVKILFPGSEISHSFASGNTGRIALVVQVDENISDLAYVGVYVDDQYESLLTPLSTTYQTYRYTGTITIEDAGSHVVRVAALDSQLRELGSSELLPIQIKEFTGSETPSAFLNNIGSDNITSTSSTVFSAQASDPDGSIVGLQYYINGQKYGDEILLPEGLADEAFTFSIKWSPDQPGIYSVLAVARDSSDNYVSSNVRNVTVTSGNTAPSVEFSAPFSLVEIKAEDLGSSLEFDEQGGISAISLPDSIPSLGYGYFSVPKVVVSGSGNGAKLGAKIDLNPLSLSFTKVIGLEMLESGSGYELNSTLITFIPTVQSNVLGEPANVSTLYDYNRTGRPGTSYGLLSSRYYIGYQIDGPQKGTGYAVSPRIVAPYNSGSRLPLETPPDGSTTSSVEVFDLTVSYPPQGWDEERGSGAALIFGGFAHAPVHFELNATASVGDIVEAGVLLLNSSTGESSQVIGSDIKVPYSVTWIPDDPAIYELFPYARDSIGNYALGKSMYVSIEEMVGSNISAEFLTPVTDTITNGSFLYLSAQATSENHIVNVEFFMDGLSLGYGDRIPGTNNYALNYLVTGIPEGEYEFSFIARDRNGNQSGSFADYITTIPERQSKMIRILPPSNYITPVIISPLPLKSQITISSIDAQGGIGDYEIVDGGASYRFSPTISFDGGGGTGAVAQPILKSGVISKIEVLNPGIGYDPSKLRLFILNDNLEHNVNGSVDKLRAELRPIFDENNGITSIEVLSGGSGYYPQSSTIVVMVDYNGSNTGTGFVAGPIHTLDGVLHDLSWVSKGTGYVSPPIVNISGGGHVFTEGQPIHMRILATDYSGIKEIRLYADNILQENRSLTFTENELPERGSGKVDVVLNEPYFDLFWVPDRDPSFGIGAIDGVGLWDLQVEVVNANDFVQRTESIQVRVVSSVQPSVSIISPVEGSEFVFDQSNAITLIADAVDSDGIVSQVEFLINDLNTDFNGTANFAVRGPPFTFNWRPEFIGDFEIRAIAYDNSGVSTLSDPINITIKQPIGEKPAANWYYPTTTDRKQQGGLGSLTSFYYYYYGIGGGGDLYFNNDFQLGSRIPLSVKASDDGSIERVEFWSNNDLLGIANQRYGDIYSFLWGANSETNHLVYAKVVDNDGNEVRTEVQDYSFGTNLGVKPDIELAYVRRSSGGMIEARVIIRNIEEPRDGDVINLTGFDATAQQTRIQSLDGDFSIHLLVNGADVSKDMAGYRSFINQRGTLYIPIDSSDPQSAKSFFYDFTDIELTETGFLSVSAVLMSRQGQDNWRQTAVSDSIELEVEEIENIESLENLPPVIDLVSPKSKDFARAVSVLESPTSAVQTSFGLSRVKMENVGLAYKTAPEVKIFGGGGSGAEAIAVVIDGAIGGLEIIQKGSEYLNGDEIFVDKIPYNYDYTGSTNYLDGDHVFYPPLYDQSVTYEDGQLVRVLYIDSISQDRLSKVWKKVGTQNAFEHQNPSNPGVEDHWTDEIGDFPSASVWKKTGDALSGQYGQPYTSEGVDDWTVGFHGKLSVQNGVLEAIQSENAIKSGGQNYVRGSSVRVVDISTGNGAVGYISKVDSNGSIVEIQITRGGKDYNPSTTYLMIEQEESGIGTGFESGTISLIHGVVSDYEILYSGEQYHLNSAITVLSNSATGNGFQGVVSDAQIRDGALRIDVVNRGRDYLVPPLILLRGGSYLASIDGYRKPLQITQDTPVYLLADANDFDGNVQEVRFYGNGDDLGIQMQRQLTDVALLSGGTGYRQPPDVFITGGGGSGAQAVAVLEVPPNGPGGAPNENAPRPIARINLVNFGSGYSFAPEITIRAQGSGSGGSARAVVQDVPFETASYEQVSGSGRWALKWVPRNPGSYVISAEVVDTQGVTTFIETNSEVVVLPTITSKIPQISIQSDINGQAFTDKSSLRFTARAQDPDGKLEGVQFYVNGELLGAEIESNYAESQIQQPYSVLYAPPSSGVYTIFAVARDNSGNHVMSDPVTFTTTSGAGLAPRIFIDKPTRAAEGEVVIDSNNGVEKITISSGGKGYSEAPIIRINGKGDDANFEAIVDQDTSSPNFSQVIGVAKKESGFNYEANSTRVEFEGGFTKINSSGQLASVGILMSERNFVSDGNLRTEYSYSIDPFSLEGGSGYTTAPRVVFQNAPQGFAAVATINALTGKVNSVVITNQGQDRNNPYPNILANFVGGLSYSEILIEAFAEDQDPNGYIKEVSFYVNGTLMSDAYSLDENPDPRAPYQILWQPGSPGIYEIYATAEDSDGNIVTSPVVRREAILSEPPLLDFNPRDRAYGFVLPDFIDANGSIKTASENSISLDNRTLVRFGNGYHSFPEVEFLVYDETGKTMSIASQAKAQAIVQDGRISEIRLLSDKDGALLQGAGYPKYRKLSGSVRIAENGEVLIGTATNFAQEIRSGQPLLLGFLGETSPIPGFTHLEVDTLQSLEEIILTNPVKEEYQVDTKYNLFTYGTEVVIKGGMDTSREPINVLDGQELALGLQVEDPEGKTIQSNAFRAYINGQEDESVQIQGSGPFYRVLWKPPALGNYNLRIQVADVDGARGISQPLDIRVSAGLEPTIKMVSPINESSSYTAEKPVTSYAIGKSISFTFEAYDYDGTIGNVEFFANSESIGRWPNLSESGQPLTDNNASSSRREEGTPRYTVSWSASYPGDYTITAAATDDSGLQSFAKVTNIEVVAPYKLGSKPPVSRIVYPKENRPEDADGIADEDPPGRKVFKPPAMTSASIIPLVANGYDVDGSLEKITFYMDGHVVPSATGYVQFIDRPLEGSQIVVSDGLGSPDHNRSFVFVKVIEPDPNFRYVKYNDEAYKFIGQSWAEVKENFPLTDEIYEAKAVIDWSSIQKDFEAVQGKILNPKLWTEYPYPTTYNTEYEGRNVVPIENQFFKCIDILKSAKVELEAGQTAEAEARLSESGNTELFASCGLYGIKTVTSEYLEELIYGFYKDSLNEQRTLLLKSTSKVLGDQSFRSFNVESEIIGFNGVLFRHTQPELLNPDAMPSIVYLPNQIEQETPIAVKGFENGLIRYPSRDSKEYHFTQLWSPPSAGVFTISAMAIDSSKNRTMSLPITVTVTSGESPPTVTMVSPTTGVQRSVSMVGRHAKAYAYPYQRDLILFSSLRYGEVFGVELTDPGAGYVSAPDVEIFGSGSGATATAIINRDPASPRFGQISEVRVDNPGEGYINREIKVEFRNGLGQEALFLNANAYDKDGEIDSVEFLINGESLTQDLTEPYAAQSEFSVGYFEVLAVAKDDAGNLVASTPSKVNVSTIRGGAPSGFVVFPLPEQAEVLYSSINGDNGAGNPDNVDYYWQFLEQFSTELNRLSDGIDVAENEATEISNESNKFRVSANSTIHLCARATDSDGGIKEVLFYLNNKFLGSAQRMNNSHHYVLPVDLASFGEQPIYRIDTVVRDISENVIVPNQPIYIDVLPATGSRPNIQIKLPEPNFSMKTFTRETSEDLLKYSTGGQVSLVLDATPIEGTVDRVAFFVNGRFLAYADLDEDIAYGTQRYALNWRPINPGVYTLTAAVKDTLGTWVFSDHGSVIEVVDDPYDLVANIEIIPPQVAANGNAVTRGSSLLANAEFLGPEGLEVEMKKVDFFLNGRLKSTQTQQPYSFSFQPENLQDRFVNAPLSWELRVTGQSTANNLVGTAIEYGTVFGISEFPTLTLTADDDGKVRDDLTIGISVVAESSNPDALLALGDVILYGNGVEIMSGAPTDNFSQTGRLLSIDYKFDWLVDFGLFAKDDGKVNLIATSAFTNPIAAGSLPVVLSNNEEVTIIRGGADDALTIYNDATGDSMTQNKLDEVFNDTNTTTPDLWYLLMDSEAFQRQVDILASYRIAMGQWPQSYAAYKDLVSTYIPEDLTGNDVWLKVFINYVLTSPDEYLVNNPMVPYMVGDESRKDSHKFGQNRRSFVEQSYFNKYSQNPTFQQVFQGSNRMLTFWGQTEPNYWELQGATGNVAPDTPPRRDTVPRPNDPPPPFGKPDGFEAGECAVDLIYNMAKEIPHEGGTPYILYSENHRERFAIAALYILLFGENLEKVDSYEIQELENLGVSNAVDRITKDYRWTSQHNLIWRNYPRIGTGDWRGPIPNNEYSESLSWFGTFYDKRYPWIYHLELDWLYIKEQEMSSQSLGFWFFSTRQNEWYWTKQELYQRGNADNPQSRLVYSSSRSDWIWMYVQNGEIFLIERNPETGLYPYLSEEVLRESERY